MCDTCEQWYAASGLPRRNIEHHLLHHPSEVLIIVFARQYSQTCFSSTANIAPVAMLPPKHAGTVHQVSRLSGSWKPSSCRHLDVNRGVVHCALCKHYWQLASPESTRLPGCSSMLACVALETELDLKERELVYRAQESTWKATSQIRVGALTFSFHSRLASLICNGH